jgi:hypothetical protein
MTKSNLIVTCVGILAFGISLHVGRAQIPASPAPTKATPPPPSKPERFDELVRDDFFSGKPELFDRAMKLCEQTLAKNPARAQAMVWHGSGLISML